MGTIIVSLILISAVALIIRSMIKARRSGKSTCSCGGKCSACSACSACSHCPAADFNKKN